MRLTSLIAPAVMFAALGALPPSATAGSFLVDISDLDTGNVAFYSGPNPADTQDVVFGVGIGGAFHGRAVATAGRVGAFADVTIPGVPGRASFSNTSAAASFSVDDLIISGPQGATSVNAPMYLYIDGSIAVGIPFGAGATAGVRLRFGAGGTQFEGLYLVGSDSRAEGIFAGVAGPTLHYQNYATSPVTLSLLERNSINVRIDVFASAGYNGGISGQTASAHSQFGHTVSLPTDGPVFDLPEGYTANSISAQIVNNRWVGGDVDADAAAVPEPSSLIVMLGSGALAGIFCGWRRRRNSHAG